MYQVYTAASGYSKCSGYTEMQEQKALWESTALVVMYNSHGQGGCADTNRIFMSNSDKKEIEEAGPAGMEKKQLTVFPERLSPKLRKNIDIKHRGRKGSKLPPYFVLSLQAELNEW